MPAKENLCDMPENMQASAVQSPKGGLSAVLPKGVRQLK